MPSPHQSLPTRRPFVAIAIYLGTFMATLAISIVNVALPAIQADLGVPLAGLQWVVGTYALCLSALMLSAGPLADRYGRKRVWLCGIALFTTGSAVSASATSLDMLIAGSALQGAAGALVIPGALSILTQAFPNPDERAHAIGGWSSFSAVSLILGPMLGGLLVDQAGWSTIFLINLPIGLLTLGLGLWAIEESAHPDHAALDPFGQGLSILFLGALTYGLIHAGHAGWSAPGTLVPLAVAALSCVAFVVVEMLVSRPVLPLDLLRQGSFASVNVASLLLGFSGYSSLFLFSLFLQQAQGWSATQTGWRMAPVFLAMTVVSSLFGRITRRFGMRCPMILGYILLGLSMLAMTSFTPDTPYWIEASLFALLGTAMGLAVPATGAAAMASAPRERTGTASATVNALRQGGMTIAIALLGAVMSIEAIATLEQGLARAGIPDAGRHAGPAVQFHALPPDIPLSPETFETLLANAMAQGFSQAAMIAGLGGLVAAVVLALVMIRATRRDRRRS